MRPTKKDSFRNHVVTSGRQPVRRKTAPKRSGCFPVLLIGLAAFVFVLLSFLGYRYFATRWPTAPAAIPPEVRMIEAPPVTPAAGSEPVVQGATGSQHYTARYDATGQLIEVKSASGAQVAQSGPSALPASLAMSAQGISFERATEALAGLRSLEGAQYDPERRQLLLIGEAGASPSQPDDLQVALRAALSHDDPSVSIDPGPTWGEMVVRFTGPVTNTHFGKVMFEADRLMKTLALGQDNITHAPVSAAVPGFRTHMDWILELEPDASADASSSWHRFWFVPKGMRLEENADSRTMRFLNADLRVLTECTDEQGRPLDVCNAPAADAFAAHLTDHYDAYAAEYPVLATLKELGKLVSLGKWLEDRSVAVDENWLATTSVPYVETLLTTSAITVTRTITEARGNGTFTQSHWLYGGVKFQFENSYEPHASAEPMPGETALDVRPAPDAVSWTVADGGRMLTAVAVSLEQENRPDLSPVEVALDLSLGRAGGMPYGVIRAPAAGQGPFGPAWRMDLPVLIRQPATLAAPVGATAAQAVPRMLSFRRRLALALRAFLFRGWTTDDVQVFESEDATEQITWTADDGYVYRASDGVQWRFDDAGRLWLLQDEQGRTVRYEYEGDDLRRIERDDGAWIDLSYRAGRLVHVQDSAGQARVYDYDASGALIGVRDGNGQTLVRYEYDASGRPAAELAADGTLLRRVHYDDAGNLSGFSQDGITFDFRRVGNGSEIAFDMPSGEATGASETTMPADAEQAADLADELARRIVSQPNDQASIRQALAGLGVAQLAALQAWGENGQLYGQMLDQAEVTFLQGPGRGMLTGEAPLELRLFESGDRRLVIYANDEARAPGRPAVIEKLLRYHRLLRGAPDETVILLFTVGSSLRVLVGDEYIEIAPRDLETFGDRLTRMLGFLPFLRSRVALTADVLALRHPTQLGQLLEAHGLVSAAAKIIRFDGDLSGLNLQRVFPAAQVYQTQDTDVEAILRRRQRLNEMQVSLADIAVLNGIPDTVVGVEEIGMNSADTTQWRAAHDKWRTTVEKRGAAITLASADALIAALELKPLVVVLVAHSDGYAIYLPDGSQFSVQSLSAEVRQTIARNAPLVWLFSCRTGSMKDGQSLAQELLRAGAAGVVAPDSDIEAETSAEVLGRFLDGIAKGQRLLDALGDALKGRDGWWFRRIIGRAPSSESRDAI